MMKIYLKMVALVVCLFAFSSCEKKATKVEHKLGFDSFVPHYNDYINGWLSEQIEELDNQLLEKEKSLSEASDKKAQQRIVKQIKDLKYKQSVHQRRLDVGEYFSFKTEADIPTDLVWEDGMDNPEIGDPRAVKGGVLHDYIPSFPPTVRPFGANANNSFRSYWYDNIRVDLVGLHPVTKKVIPGVAKQWAVAKDGRTVYFRLDSEATYSDGISVKAKDFMTGVYVRVSDVVKAPYPRQYYREQIANITVYGENLLSVSLPDKKPLLAYYCNLSYAQTEFYKEFGPDYEDRYQWKMEPTTGAYIMRPEGLKKGRSITMSRVKDWWAKDKKFYRYGYNVDKLHYQVIAKESKVFELFRVGQIDAYLLKGPSYWYDKMEVDEYFDGYIKKAQFYNDAPRPTWGVYLNVTKGILKNRDVRIGIAHALNFNKVNTVLSRGDNERLNHFSEGFGEFSNPNVKAREFSISKAREHFAKAGFDQLNSEGYLINKDGKVLELEMSWAQKSSTDKMMALIQEDAKKVGLKMLFDSQQGNVFFAKMLEKRHQAGFMGWSATLPFPRYFGSFHSSNAFDDDGKPKLQTNNINVYSNPRMDTLTETVRSANSLEQLKNAAWEAQQLIHDEGLYIPGLKVAYARMGYWRWIKWPQTKYTEFCAPTNDRPLESHLFWIDQKEKEATLRAMEKGQTFPEENLLFQLYRGGTPVIEELEARSENTNKN